MKVLFLNALIALVSTLIISSFASHASAESKCADQARVAALKFVHKSTPGIKSAKDAGFFLYDDKNGLLQYAVLVDVSGSLNQINIGLSKGSCQIIAANYVSDAN